MAASSWMPFVSHANLNEYWKAMIETGSKGTNMLVFIWTWGRFAHFARLRATWSLYRPELFVNQYVHKFKAFL